jgi:hypothetical protein
MNTLAPPERYGEALGLVTTARYVGILMGPAVGILLASGVGYTPAFLAASGVLTLTALAALLWLPPHTAVMSPASIHCGLVLLESTVAHCSIASAPLRAFLNPDECGSAVVTAMGSKACRYNACLALSCIVGRPRGRVFPLDCGIDTLRRGRVLYPLFCRWGRAIALLTGSVQMT